jgi:hypothetical protein
MPTKSGTTPSRSETAVPTTFAEHVDLFTKKLHNSFILLLFQRREFILFLVDTHRQHGGAAAGRDIATTITTQIASWRNYHG